MKTTNHEQTMCFSFCKAMLISLMMLISLSFVNAGIVITGKVTDEVGNGLPGATVLIKGTSKGTVTSMDGNFSIEVPNTSSVLVICYVGYTTQEVVVNNNKVINITMAADVQALDEVVVVGYGTQKKSLVTGSIAKVDAKEFRKAKSFEQALQGRVAGVAVVQSNQTYFNPSVESYSSINENGFKNSKANPLSTFSIDVDRASYSNVKRFLNNGELPPADAVRIEEMINYFEYDYPQPKDEHPFSITTEYSDCPWQGNHKLLNIGIQGKKIATDNLPPSNLVFLIDVSGSMSDPNKLPLLKSAFKLLVNNLRDKDRVAIVVYAGAAGLVLPSTSGDDKNKILDAIDRLQSGGSTAGAEGIRLAYDVAKENFLKEGNNRVILATDGDFNVGLSNENELEDLITNKRKSGIFLTCIGVGMGNYKDSKLEILADKGNGNYAYINDIQEANKTFVNEFGGTLFTIAKDVKIQVEFNPAFVQSYRLVGYENRMLNEEDFKDDAKDAGELGAGHTVTAIYEIIPVGVKSNFTKDVATLKYQPNINETMYNSYFAEVATVKFRYKKPDGDKSIEMVHPIIDNETSITKTTDNFKFSASVAMFGMLLRNSEFKGICDYAGIIELAENGRGKDKDGYRAEFVRLVKTAKNGAYRLSENNSFE
jgi:Ca-activated chloride channel family protein